MSSSRPHSSVPNKAVGRQLRNHAGDLPIVAPDLTQSHVADAIAARHGAGSALVRLALVMPLSATVSVPLAFTSFR